MNLIWHLAKKDLRRLGGASGLWVAFVVGATVWFGARHVTGDDLIAGDPAVGMREVMAMVGLVSTLQGVAALLLAGAVVLEDPVGSANAGWRTRPISGARLLGAKAVTVGLLLVVAPTTALVPVWLAHRFSVWECAAAWGNLAGAQALLVLLAMAIAALVETTAQFTLACLGVAAVYAFLASRLPLVWLGIDVGGFVGPIASRAATGVMVAAAVAVLLQQYFTRRRARSWGVLATALLSAALLQTGWVKEAREPVNRFAGERLEGAREVALEEGAVAESGADRLSVVYVRDAERGRPGRVVLEEGGSWKISRPWWDGPEAHVDLGPWDFEAVDARSGAAIPMRVVRITTTGHARLALRVWELEADAAVGAGKILRRTPRAEGREEAGNREGTKS